MLQDERDQSRIQQTLRRRVHQDVGRSPLDAVCPQRPRLAERVHPSSELRRVLRCQQLVAPQRRDGCLQHAQRLRRLVLLDDRVHRRTVPLTPIRLERAPLDDDLTTLVIEGQKVLSTQVCHVVPPTRGLPRDVDGHCQTMLRIVWQRQRLDDEKLDLRLRRRRRLLRLRLIRENSKARDGEVQQGHRFHADSSKYASQA